MERPSLRTIAEIALITLGLTAFAAGGFVGLSAWNAHLEATGHTYPRPALSIDTHIPLRIEWIWPYLSYYPGCFLPALLLTSMENLRRVAAAYAVEFGLAFVFFYSVPMRMDQPEIVGRTLSHDAIRWLYSIDPGYNIFPSLHTANALMIAAAFQHAGPRWSRPLLWLWALSICASTVLVKQHYILDVAAGAILAYVTARICFRGWRRTGEGDPALQPAPATR